VNRVLYQFFLSSFSTKKEEEKQQRTKSTFGMQLAKCFRSRLTEKGKSSYFQSSDLYFMFVSVLIRKAM